MSKTKLFQKIRNSKCLACGIGVSDVAHVRSRGAGGGDQDWNVIPLCRFHHRLQHTSSWNVFCERHPRVFEHLKSLGWDWLECNGIKRLWNDKLNRD